MREEKEDPVPLTSLDRAFLSSRLSSTSFSLVVFPSIELSNPLRASRARGNAADKNEYRHLCLQTYSRNSSLGLKDLN